MKSLHYKGLRVCIAASLPFPNGGASTSRTRSLALGLEEAGAKVVVLAMQDGIHQEGEWRGIETHTSWKTTIPASFGPVAQRSFRKLAWNLPFLRPYLREEISILLEIYRLASTKSIDAVLYYNQDGVFAGMAAAICRQFGITYIQQMAEWQQAADYRMKWLAPLFIQGQLNYRFSSRLFDGAVVISRALQTEMEARMGSSCLRVPALLSTEPSPFTVGSADQDQPMVFSYLGSGAPRDLVPLIIDGFSECVHRGNTARLLLIGLHHSAVTAVQRQVRSLGLESLVDIYGFMDADRLKTLSASATAWIWLRAYDRSGRAAFPTRLPEFLLSARPVLVSMVGDMGEYLTDGVDVMAVKQNHPRAVASSMAALCADRGLAHRIGSQGAVTAQQKFSIQTWGRELMGYIADVSKRTTALRANV